MKLPRPILVVWFAAIFAGLNLLTAWQIYNAPLRSGLLMSGFILLGLISLLGLAVLARASAWQEKLLRLIEQWKNWLLVSGLVGLSAGWLAASLTADAQSGWFLALRPAFGWLAYLGALVILLLALLAALAQKKQTSKNSLTPGLTIFVLLLVLTGFMAISGLGLEPVGYYWYAPGTPLLSSQVLMALFAGGALALFLKSGRGKKITPSRLDGILATALFVLAAATWLMEPLNRPVNFLPEKLPPNYQLYPDSDSAYLDINAQRLLAGQALSVDPADKPTYSFFLYILHLLAGQDFETLLNLQVITLAFIPPILYFFFTIGLDNRPAGLAASILLILREINSIQLSNIILVSHPKLLLSDVPSAGLMILLALLVLGWVRTPGQRQIWPIWAGIIFAAFLLLRTQVIVLAPLIIIGIAFVLRRESRQMLALAAILATLGFAAFSLPWAIYGLNAPASANASAYVRQLAIQFQFDPLNHNVRPQAGESETVFSARMREQVVEFISENPGYTLKAISAYFFRNLAQGFLYLPASFRLETDPSAYTSRLPYWNDWTGNLPTESLGILTLNLFLIANGLATAWRKFGPSGLFPLLLYLGYLASLAIPMISGWRFLLPADWIMLVYYLLGASALAEFLWDRLGPEKRASTPIKIDRPTQANLSWRQAALPLTLAVSFSASLFLAEAVTPERYPHQTKSQLQNTYLSIRPELPETPNADAVADFLAQPQATLLHGRVLYPRFFEAGEGFSRNGLISFRPYTFPRLGFYLLGPQPAHVLLPLTTSPDIFPHAADIWVLGCHRDTDYFHRAYVEALVVVLPGEDMVVWQKNQFSLKCQE